MPKFDDESVSNFYKNAKKVHKALWELEKLWDDNNDILMTALGDHPNCNILDQIKVWKGTVDQLRK